MYMFQIPVYCAASSEIEFTNMIRTYLLIALINDDLEIYRLNLHFY